MQYIKISIFLCIFFISFNILAANNVWNNDKSFMQAKSLSLPCLGCHGQNNSSVPSLYNLKESYIYKALIEYQSGHRENYLMQIISKGYSDEQLRIISKYYSLQGDDNE
ncbi:hypothetical protein OAE09_01585 [Alphaproteobacteria bacterium]|jgi:sulfide dehydrogenase cytochrome subunit|nr:hypothetical protein [Alphaproteobacteria bacterium]